MAQATQHYDTDPQRPPRLTSDEQRIADAVVAALRSELQPIKDTQEQHTKILENIQLEMRGVNRILAGAGLIPDNPDI
ncbi:MAG: hypothetical protein OXG23_09695 [Chloroflexi bacterium]|nr:hypothetical protein [Chloroflexota bacterium]MCY3978360.1 hypothetical protein [Chloroflexota bacterium]